MKLLYARNPWFYLWFIKIYLWSLCSNFRSERLAQKSLHGSRVPPPPDNKVANLTTPLVRAITIPLVATYSTAGRSDHPCGHRHPPTAVTVLRRCPGHFLAHVLVSLHGRGRSQPYPPSDTRWHGATPTPLGDMCRRTGHGHESHPTVVDIHTTAPTEGECTYECTCHWTSQCTLSSSLLFVRYCDHSHLSIIQGYF